MASREEYAAAQAEQQVELDKELAVIRAKQVIERAAKEKVKEEAVIEAQARMVSAKTTTTCSFVLFSCLIRWGLV